MEKNFRLPESYVNFEELRKRADYAIESIETLAVQLPTAENPMAIFSAAVRTKDGRLFVAHGDASPNNVNQYIAPHFIRMAETRAVARALRFMLGEGAVADVELQDIPVLPPPASRSQAVSKKHDKAEKLAWLQKQSHYWLGDDVDKARVKIARILNKEEVVPLEKLSDSEMRLLRNAFVQMATEKDKILSYCHQNFNADSAGLKAQLHYILVEIGEMFRPEFKSLSEEEKSSGILTVSAVAGVDYNAKEIFPEDVDKAAKYLAVQRAMPRKSHAEN